MGQKLVVILAVVALSATFSLPSAQAQSTASADVVARINNIVAEMDALRQELQSLTTQIGAPTPHTPGTGTTDSALSAAAANLEATVTFGATNDTIEKVQRLLDTDSTIYDHPYVTGFFGDVTKESIANLQTRFGLSPAIGIVGPQTSALLTSYFVAYPNENYPTDVLKTKPPVVAAAGGNSSNNNSSTPTATMNNPARVIVAELDDGIARVEVEYTNGDDDNFLVRADTESEAVAAIARVTDLTSAQVRAVISFDGRANSTNDDESDAEDAIDDASDAINDAEDEINDADDGEDVDYAEELLEEAEDALDDAEKSFDDEDYDEAIELAEEAESLAKDAEDAIGEEPDSDEIDEIKVDVTDEDEAQVKVEYEDGDDDDFTVDEDQRDNIIEEIADELDIDEDEVEDVIEFDYGDIADIDVQIEDGEARVTVEYESEVEERFVIDEDDENEMIESIADILDVDENDVEDNIDFDYR